MSHKSFSKSLFQLTRSVECCKDTNTHTHAIASAHTFRGLGIDNSYNFEDFCTHFDIRITSFSNTEIIYDMIGVDPSIANALRRIMISEVPTMAIEDIFLIKNTSILQDEALGHRLGLVPIFADPTRFDFRGPKEKANEKNTIVFRLVATFEKTRNPTENKKIFSDALVWLPNGSEIPEETGCRFCTCQNNIQQSLRPVHENILLAILGPSQEIILEAHCTKGIGKTHAKWSPVATGWYRLLPSAALLQAVDGDLADELSEELPGLVTVEGKGPHRRAILGEARDHELLLEKFRFLSSKEKWAPYIQLKKIKDHFIFTIESSGVLSPKDIFNQAIMILINKIDTVFERL